MGGLEMKSKDGFVVHVSILINALFTFLLIIYVAQQQREITNLREILNKHVQKQSQSIERITIEPSGDDEHIKSEITQTEKNLKEYDHDSARLRRGTNSKCCAKRRRCCRKGSKGERGDQGIMGMTGPMGHEGHKGRRGTKGIKGDPGAKGDIGPPGQMPTLPTTQSFVESAHIIGSGITEEVTLANHGTTKWHEKHVSGNMTYNPNGFLRVEVGGFYYIYSQMYYYDGKATLMAHTLQIDQAVVLSGYNSANKNNMFNSNYIGGVFHIKKGQRISVGLPFTTTYHFDPHSSYFGAFMIHPVKR